MKSQSRNHLMQLTGPVALALTLTILLMGQARPEGPTQKKEITAQRFVLVDSTGKECAWLMAGEDDSPVLLLRKGRASASLNLSDPVMGLGFRGKDGKRGAWIGIGTGESPGVSLYGESLKGGIRLMVESDGSPHVTLGDATGKTVWKAP